MGGPNVLGHVRGLSMGCQSALVVAAVPLAGLCAWAPDACRSIRGSDLGRPPALVVISPHPMLRAGRRCCRACLQMAAVEVGLVQCVQCRGPPRRILEVLRDKHQPPLLVAPGGDLHAATVTCVAGDFDTLPVNASKRTRWLRAARLPLETVETSPVALVPRAAATNRSPPASQLVALWSQLCL